MKKALMTAHVAYAIELFNIPNIALLQSLGYQVQVACNFDDRSSLSDEKVEALKAKLDKMGVKYHNIPFQRQPLKKENLKAYKQLKALIDSEGFSVVHCHTPVGGIITRLACIATRKKNNTRVIYTAHGFHFYKGAPKKNWLLYFTAEKLCSYFTDCLITINKEDYIIAQRRLNASEVCYVPGVGIDCSAMEKAENKRASLLREIGAGQDSVILMGVGELSDRKNHSVSIEALSRLKRDNVHLVIAGTGEKKRELIEKVRSLSLDGRVHFLGFRTDIYELLKSADIFIFPSLQEGLPVALMEAMAAGLPVVCSEIRGNVDLIDETTGILCPQNDSEAFAEALTGLLENESFRCRLCENCIRKSKSYDIGEIHKQMKEIYSQGESYE